MVTWAELFDSSIVIGRVDWQEILEPGNFWVRITASGTEHGGRPRTLHHFQLGTHVYGGEPRGQLVLWKDQIHKLNIVDNTHIFSVVTQTSGSQRFFVFSHIRWAMSPLYLSGPPCFKYAHLNGTCYVD